MPEVNPDAIEPAHRIFPVANCTAIVLTVALAPIERAVGLRAVRVATYQAVSGAGRAGLDALAREENGGRPTAPSPRRSTATSCRRSAATTATATPAKSRRSRPRRARCSAAPDLVVAATTVRVPVRRAHSEAVFFETAVPTDVERAARRAARRARRRAARARHRHPARRRGHRPGPRRAPAPGVRRHHRPALPALGRRRPAPQRRRHQRRADPRAADRAGPFRGGARVSEIVVLKFGGSSLSSAELREIAASRVLDVLRRGQRPVVVCSALGRAPEPYATDTPGRAARPGAQRAQPRPAAGLRRDDRQRRVRRAALLAGRRRRRR